MSKLIKNRFLRILLRIFLGIFVFLALVILFIRSPWGQNIIVSRAISYVEGKTGTEVRIDRLYLTFAGNLSLEGLYLEDEQKDTLVYSDDLEVSLALLPLIKGTEINIKSVKWDGLRAKISRPAESESFNFQFLIDAFATAPDTTAASTSSPELKIGDINLAKVNLDYDDKFTGMNASLQLGELNLEVNNLDFEQMIYEINALSISNSKIVYEQSKSIEKREDATQTTSSVPLPVISVGELALNNVVLDYQSQPDQTFALLDIGELSLEVPNADLKEQKIVLDQFVFNDSKVAFKQTPLEQTTVQNDSIADSSPMAFEWPDWEVEAKSISLHNNQIELQTANTYLDPGVFNPEWIKLQNLNFEASNIVLKSEEAHLELEELALTERSGLTIKKTNFTLDINEQEASLSKLDFASQENALSGSIEIQYSSLTNFLNSPDSASVSLDLDQFKVGLKEAAIFSPELVENQYLQSLAQKSLTGAVKIKGRLSDIDISELEVKWGEQTAVNLSGNVKNALDVDRVNVDLPTVNVQTTKSDLSQLMDTTGLSVELPENIALNGNISGGLNDAQADLTLNTTSGNVALKGNFVQKEMLAFDATIEGNDLQLDQILQNPQLDTVSFSMEVEGRGKSLNDLTAQLTTDFERLRYNGYDFSNLKLSADIEEGNGDIHLSFKDENLDMTMETMVELDSVTPKIETKLTVNGADLYELGLARNNIRTAFVLNANFKGNADNFDLSSNLNDGVAIYQQDAYNYGNFILNAHSRPDTLNVSIQSQTLDAKITANKSLGEVIPMLQGELEFYLNNSETIRADSLSNTQVKMNMVVRQSPLLSEVLLPDIESMDSISFDLDFDTNSQHISANLLAPYLLYQGSEVDSLGLKINGENNKLKFLVGWEGVNSGPISIDKTKLEGTVDHGVIQSSLNIIDNDEILLNISSEVQLRGDTVQVHLLTDTLIFNSQPWSVLAQNRLVLASNYVQITDFELTNGAQKLTLGTSLSGQEKEHVGAVFNNFQLATFTSLLNAEKPLLSGTLNGDIVMENPFGSYGLVAGLSISDLATLNIPLGELNLEARSTGTQKYEAQLSLAGENANLDVTGSYLAAASGGDITLDLDLESLDMAVIEALSNESISQSSGNLSGTVKLSGNTNDPQYSGTLNFNDVSLLVNELNTQFSIAQEQVKVDNAGLYLNEFVITDSDQNDFTLAGEVLTENLMNPNFDLSLKTNNFGIVNSTEEDSDLFYGQVNMDADLTITGDLNVPKIRGSLNVNDGSTLTFTVPESQLELKERDGVVLFVNRENPDNILTQIDQNESSLSASISGYDIETVITIGENSQFNIIIDKTTGDNLQVTGNGDFNLSLEPNGRTSLSGKYELSGGHYEASLFNLVKRRFEISPGSAISWTGDPYDANLDVKAIYSIKTSAGPLMAARTSSEDTGLETSYQERLPFQVYINVEGKLLKPEISFTLDMPDDERGALSGTVYSQVQQLNGQEEELNKQVFSLLVLNRFFPSAGSDGSNGGPTSLAMDNVNKVLSSQLNNYSDKLFGNTGIDVGFNLNSTAGNQSNGGQTQTQLGITAKKQFFNDRLIVKVGSEVEVAGGQNTSQGTPIIGNVSLEYLLTEDKRLRLKGFSKNEYAGVIDGQLTVSGIALVFNREFNKFKELWAKQVKEEVEKQNKEKENK